MPNEKWFYIALIFISLVIAVENVATKWLDTQRPMQVAPAASAEVKP